MIFCLADCGPFAAEAGQLRLHVGAGGRIEVVVVAVVVVVVGRPVVVVTERRTRSSWAIKKRLNFVRALVRKGEIVVVVSAEAPCAAHELLDGQPRGAAEAEIEDECSGGRLHVSGSVRGVERRGESGLGEPERLMRLWDKYGACTG